jgi:LysR family transcriptional regulator, glycine cleavage system transcriptional activator
MKRLPPLNALRAFSMAAHFTSFTKAGEVMHVTQGAVSRQVKLLEDWLGVRLFVREHPSISLTPAGRALAHGLSQAFALMEESVAHVVQAQHRQMLNINVPPTFATRWLAPRLASFRLQCPHIDLSITTDRIVHRLEARQHDCLVVYAQQGWPQMHCERLMQEKHISVCSPSLWSQHQPPSLRLATLLHILDGHQRLPVWEQWVTTHGLTDVNTQAGLNFSTLDQAINASKAGAGIVLVDKAMVVRDLAEDLLRRMDDREMDGPYGYWFIDVTSKPEQKSMVAAFRQWLMAQVGQDPPTP